MTASEANQRFSELLRRVQQGETFTITSRGRPVARVEQAAESWEERVAKQREWLAKLESLPIRHAYGWTRDELYDR